MNYASSLANQTLAAIESGDPVAIASCALVGVLSLCMIAIQHNLSTLRQEMTCKTWSLAERLDAVGGRLEGVEDQLTDDSSLTKSIFSKIDDLSDFVRNKIVLKKDKVKPF
jgi:hypothetical protein